jgi:hypothetical protein
MREMVNELKWKTCGTFMYVRKVEGEFDNNNKRKI